MNDLLRYKDYLGSVQFSAEDEVFYGKVLGVNDFVSFEGESVKELKNAFEEAVEDYLATCRKLKRDPDKTFKGSFNIRISAQLHKEAAAFATAHNISLNDFVKKAIILALQKQGSLAES